MNLAERRQTQQELPEVAVAKRMAKQHGVIHRRQAVGCGMSAQQVNRLASKGAWVIVFPAVYRAASSRVTWRLRLMAAVLWAGPGAVISHRAAACLWELIDDVKIIEIIGPIRKKPPPGVVIHRTDTLNKIDIGVRQGILVTSVHRTLVDLGAVVDECIVEKALERARRRGFTSIPFLFKVLERSGGRGRRGAGVLKALIDERDPNGQPIGSDMAVECWQLIRKSKLLRPIPEYEIWGEGEFIARPDFVYPRLRIVIEVDGRETHDTSEAYYDDRGRDTMLRARGWVVLRFTKKDIRERPKWLLTQIAVAIAHA